MKKIKDKEKILKTQITCKGIPKRLSADFSAENLKERGSGMIYLK